MKTIELTDEDYNTLMELSKELQLQDNNSQSFPYFWTPSSEKLEIDVNDEGSVEQFYYGGENYDVSEEGLRDFAYGHESLWEKFCKYHDFLDGDDVPEYHEDNRDEWEEYLRDSTDAHFYSSNWVRKRDYNPSLFHSDVEQYCENNKHHLGRKPWSYSDSIWRMPKMESLVKCLVRINKQPKEEVNHEARRFVYPKEG